MKRKNQEEEEVMELEEEQLNNKTITGAEEVAPLPPRATRMTIRKLAQKRGRETYFIKFRQIKIRENFNVRDEEDFEDLAELAEMIKSNGLTPLTVDITSDNSVWLEIGHRRVGALQILWDEGWLQKAERPGISKGAVECFINPIGTDEIKRIKGLLASNYMKPLSFKAKTKIAHRLKNMDGKKYSSNEQIAKELGISRQTVDNMLILALHDSVHEAVDSGIIKPTVAVAMVRKLKDDTKIEKFMEKALEKGEEVKLKDIKELGKPKEKMHTWQQEDEDAVISEDEDDAMIPAEEPEQSDDDHSEPDPVPGLSTFKGIKKNVTVVPSDDKEELKQANKSTKARETIVERKLTEVKDEETWLTDIATNIDRIGTICNRAMKKGADLDEIERLIKFSHQKIESVKAFVHKAQKPE